MPIRVLVVDDSAFMRKAIADILKRDPEIEVIGEAKDGVEAVQKILELSPDVVTLDYEMPGKNGLEVIREVLKKKFVPIVMISSYTKEGAMITLRCLEEGAVDFISKDIEKGTLEVFRKAQEIIEKVKNAARVKGKAPVVMQKPRFNQAELHRPRPTPAPARAPSEMRRVVVIGASTGGPNSVMTIFSLLSNIPAGFVVAIHMPPVFTETYAQRLSEKTGFPAKEGQEGDVIEPGKIIVCKGGIHTMIRPGGVIHLTNNYPSIYKPSIDLLMKSAADVFGNKVIGVILTGMGNDGVEGMRAIKNKGGVTIAESEVSAVVWGMPKMVIQAGLADYVEDLHKIPSLIENLVMGGH